MTFPKIFDFIPSKNIIKEFWLNFSKKQIQIIANGNIRTRLKKSMVQVDAVQGCKRNMSYTNAQNRYLYKKIFRNSIKSAGYTRGLRKLPLQYALIFQWYLQKTERFTFFICLFDTTRDSMIA